MELDYFDKLALSTFTSLEKQSFFQLLSGAMIVDGQRDQREIAVINSICNAMHFTIAEHEASRKHNFNTLVDILRKMDNTKKAIVGKYMARVVLADGVITPKEEQFFYQMKDILQLPDID